MFDLRDALAAQSEGLPIVIEALRDGAPLLFSIRAGEGLGAPFGTRKPPLARVGIPTIAYRHLYNDDG